MTTFFEQGHKSLAKALVGRKLMVGGIEVEILSAQGFSRKENEAPLYEPILSKVPGEVYCPRNRGAILLLVACQDVSLPGGCVLIRKVKIGEVEHNGPGKVTEALGITEHKSEGQLREVRGKLVLEMD